MTMYSVVLMLAVTGGAESVDFGGRGCNGCHGYNGCHRAVSHGCHGRDRCHGCFGGLFHRDRGCHGCHNGNGCHRTHAVAHHGCHNGCHNGNGCHRSRCHGRDRCHGGLFSRFHNRCNGCNGGCHNGYGCHGCNGGVVYPGPEPVRIDPKTMPKEKSKKEEEEVSDTAPATIIVMLPAGAKLMVDGNATRSTSDRRTFITPALEMGSDYVYTLQAEVMVDGQVSVQTRDVTVRSGETTEVSFTFASQGVASR
jgi:uncharacterized protein (TIGR03000 family)